MHFADVSIERSGTEAVHPPLPTSLRFNGMFVVTKTTPWLGSNRERLIGSKLLHHNKKYPERNMIGIVARAIRVSTFQQEPTTVCACHQLARLESSGYMISLAISEFMAGFLVCSSPDVRYSQYFRILGRFTM